VASLPDISVLIRKPVRFAAWAPLAANAVGMYLIFMQLAPDQRLDLPFDPCDVMLGEKVLRVKQLQRASEADCRQLLKRKAVFSTAILAALAVASHIEEQWCSVDTDVVVQSIGTLSGDGRPHDARAAPLPQAATIDAALLQQQQQQQQREQQQREQQQHEQQIVQQLQQSLHEQQQHHLRNHNIGKCSISMSCISSISSCCMHNRSSKVSMRISIGCAHSSNNRRSSSSTCSMNSTSSCSSS
jgi:hypothetical protein